MAPNPFLGVLFHAIGGFAAGSFYIPFGETPQGGHGKPTG